MKVGAHSRFITTAIMLCVAMLLCIPSAFAVDAKKSVRLRSYDSQATVPCFSGFSYTPVSGCTLANGRINQLSIIGGKSSLLGLAQCMPDFSNTISTEQPLVSGTNLSGSKIMQLESGDVILAYSSSSSVLFYRYTAQMELATPASVAIVSGTKGFANYNAINNENIQPTGVFDITPLNGTRWAIAFVGASSVTGRSYVFGAVVNQDVLEKPAVTTFDGERIFPISYADDLFDVDAAVPVQISTNNSAVGIKGFVSSNGKRDGRFVAAWLRKDYYKPIQQYSIFGKFFDATDTPFIPTTNFGTEQGQEVRMENTIGAASSLLNRSLLPLKSTQGMALVYSDSTKYTVMSPGATYTGSLQLFKSDGSVYTTSGEFTGVVRNVPLDNARNTSLVEVTGSKVLMAGATLSGTSKIQFTGFDISSPAAPALIDMNGAASGNEYYPYTSDTNYMYNVMLTSRNDNADKVMVTWLDVDHSLTNGRVKGQLLTFDGTATLTPEGGLNSWFLIDPGAADAYSIYAPSAAAGQLSVNTIQTETIDNAGVTQYYFVTKYDRTNSSPLYLSVYRRYIVPNCW